MADPNNKPAAGTPRRNTRAGSRAPAPPVDLARAKRSRAALECATIPAYGSVMVPSTVFVSSTHANALVFHRGDGLRGTPSGSVGHATPRADWLSWRIRTQRHRIRTELKRKDRVLRPACGQARWSVYPHRPAGNG